MRTFKNTIIPKEYRGSAIALGNFDGVHRGHQKVFKQAKKYAKKNKIKFGVLTFTPLPAMFFNRNIKNCRLISENTKFELFERYGVDFVINIKFNKIFSKITAVKFIKNIIFKKINPKLIFVSNNFKFGNKREGDVSKLIKYEKKYNYKIIKPKPFKKKNKIISSSLIRKLLVNGKVWTANKLLKRNWSIEGVVEKGRQMGKTIGFPTCNIDIKNYVLAKPGVYAVKIYQKNKFFYLKGVANLGYRPTFKQKKILLEVHIFNFSGNLYNKRLTIEFIDFIRKEKKFKNINQLKKQIKLDLKIAKKKLK